MVGQTHNLVGDLILPRVFPVGKNVWYVFRLIEQILILVGHCPMSDRYFKAWHMYDFSEKKYFFYILSTDQISLSAYFYFLRHW